MFGLFKKKEEKELVVFKITFADGVIATRNFYRPSSLWHKQICLSELGIGSFDVDGKMYPMTSVLNYTLERF